MWIGMIFHPLPSRGFTWNILFSLKNNENIFKNVVCCNCECIWKGWIRWVLRLLWGFFHISALTYVVTPHKYHLTRTVGHNICFYDKTGKKWVNRLPVTLCHLEHRWSLVTPHCSVSRQDYLFVPLIKYIRKSGKSSREHTRGRKNHVRS